MTSSQSEDDDLIHFAENGAASLPPHADEGFIEHEGARLWYATWGSGPTVVLLHGGLGHSGNWGYQVPALVDAGYRTVVIDSRGHGRSTRDERPYSYELMASDVLAVLDALRIQKAALVGWSDGACIAATVARNAPERVTGVFFFACNMDPSGARPLDSLPAIVKRCFGRHVQDYKRMSPTPSQFDTFSQAVTLMQQTQPDWRPEDLAALQVPVLIVQSQSDEFILWEHAVYLARSIPKAEVFELTGVSHFAPLQRPQRFNRVLLEFLGIWNTRSAGDIFGYNELRSHFQ